MPEFDRSMEMHLGLTEKRASNILKKMAGWGTAKGTRASHILKKLVKEFSDRIEMAFAAYQFGRAIQLSEIDDIFSRYTGVSLESIITKLMTTEVTGLAIPDIDEIIRASLYCPICKFKIDRCPKCGGALYPQ